MSNVAALAAWQHPIPLLQLMGERTEEGVERIRWASAPELEQLDGLIVGTREQVIACLRLQASLRKLVQARLGVGALSEAVPPDKESLAAELVRRAIDAAVECFSGSGTDNDKGHKLHTHLHTQCSDGIRGDRDTEEPAGIQCAAADEKENTSVVIKDLDTGLAIALSDLDSMYARTPLTTFESRQLAASHVATARTTSLANIRSSSSSSSEVRATVSVALGGRQRGESILGSGGGLGSLLAADHSNALARRDRRRNVRERATQPLMCGPLLKRGKKLGQWKLRWYSLSFDGELTCHRQRGDVDRKPPMFTILLGQAPG